MNIVHIIGNGFDLNLNLKTSYRDFYDYYIKVENEDKNVQLLKEEIKTDSENWSDLEIALGKFTAKVKTVDEFELLRQDIVLNLSNYLKLLQDSFDPKDVDVHELLIFLASPHIELRNGDKAACTSLINTLKHETAFIDIISFNYTSILDKLIEKFVNKEMNFAKAINKNSVIRPVKHIHGSLQERLILGVNDNSQVANDDFTNDIDFTEAFIKTEYNKATSHLIDDECVNLINKANAICVFGSSLGATDSFWWKLICERLLTGNCKLIIYHKNFSIESNLFDNLISKEIRHIKERFVSFNSNLSNEEKEFVKSNICVNVNSNFFKILMEVEIINAG